MGGQDVNKAFSYKLTVFIAALVVLIDQLTKYLTKVYMSLGDSIPVLGNFFRLTYIENPGMAFGIEIGNKVVFTILSIGAAVIVFYYLFKLRHQHLPLQIALSLILGGAIGNLIDRLLYGRVVDFFDVEFFDIHIAPFKILFIEFPGFYMNRWPVFNIADSAVSVGMAIVAYFVFFHKDKDTIFGENENISGKLSPNPDSQER